VPLGAIGRLRGRRTGGAREPLRYGTKRGETLEILHPHRNVEARPPVVYVHGGGWIFGRKEMYTADLDFLCARGHRVYNFDYPLAPEHPFPVALQSLVGALAWLRERHEECQRVHLMGDSAGGNLVMMLGLLLSNRERLLELDPDLAKLTLPEIRSVISLYGVLDRLSWLEHRFPFSELMLHCYGGRAAFEPEVGPELALTPLDLVVSQRPACLLAIGTADPLAESSRLAEKHLTPLDGKLELRTYEGEGHAFFNLARREKSQQLRCDIESFLEGL
jgi:acetyl esterase/lipase